MVTNPRKAVTTSLPHSFCTRQKVAWLTRQPECRLFATRPAE